MTHSPEQTLSSTKLERPKFSTGIPALRLLRDALGRLLISLPLAAGATVAAMALFNLMLTDSEAPSPLWNWGSFTATSIFFSAPLLVFTFSGFTRKYAPRSLDYPHLSKAAARRVNVAAADLDQALGIMKTWSSVHFNYSFHALDLIEKEGDLIREAAQFDKWGSDAQLTLLEEDLKRESKDFLARVQERAKHQPRYYHSSD